MTGVTEHYRQGYKVMEVDTSKAEYKHIPWRELGSFGKRKFENILFLQNTMQNPKIIYV